MFEVETFNLTKKFGDLTAVKSVNLKIERGEIFGLLGPVQTLLNIVSKEFIQISRDLRSLILIIVIPLFLLVIFGYGVTMDIKNVNLVVCDLNRTQHSRRLIERFTSSGFFNLTAEINDINQVDHYLISGKAKVGIVLPHNFYSEIGAGRTAKNSSHNRR